MDYNELARRIDQQNLEKGFDVKPTELNRKLMLVISELAEAQDELRSGKAPTEVYYQAESIDEFNFIRKPCGFGVELADAAIRILHILAAMNIPVRTLKGYINIKDESDIDGALLKICRLVGASQSEHFVGVIRDQFGYLLNSAFGQIQALANSLHIDLDTLIEEKLKFNAERPYMHGRKF